MTQDEIADEADRCGVVGTVGKKWLRLLLPVYWMFTQPGGYRCIWRQYFVLCVMCLW